MQCRCRSVDFILVPLISGPSCHSPNLLGTTSHLSGLIPSFMLCNASPESRTLPVIIDSDIAFAIMVAVLGLTVGYIGNICLILAPKTSGLYVITSGTEESGHWNQFLLNTCFFKMIPQVRKQRRSHLQPFLSRLRLQDLRYHTLLWRTFDSSSYSVSVLLTCFIFTYLSWYQNCFLSVWMCRGKEGSPLPLIIISYCSG